MDVISTGRSSATREKLKKMIKFVDVYITLFINLLGNYKK